MPFLGQGLAPSDWGPAAETQMKLFLREMYAKNETSHPYEFTNASAGSGWSFGQAQWDVRKGDRQTIANFLTSIGFGIDEIQRLAKNPDQTRFPPITRQDLDGFTDSSGVRHPGLDAAGSAGRTVRRMLSTPARGLAEGCFVLSSGGRFYPPK